MPFIFSAKKTRALHAVFAASAIALLWGWTASSSAQLPGEVRAQIWGRITDSDGQGVPGVNIAVTGAALSTAISTSTDAEGHYRLEAVLPGLCQVATSHIGYQPAVEKNIPLRPGDRLELNFALEATVFTLDQYVVSASRAREKILDSPASVAVVETREIGDRAALNVAAHIGDLPGVDMAKVGLVQSNTVARGFNNIFSGELLTLTDNRIARVPSLRVNNTHFIPLTDDDIERIEVVLGPASALYGPNSANGVMHIITHSPFNSVGTSVRAGIGERSLRTVALRHAGAANPELGYKISAQYYTGNDWKSSDPAEEAARAADPHNADLKPRDFDIERLNGEVRLDYSPRLDLSTVLTAGFNQSSGVELTGLGAAQAIDWRYGFVQGRLTFRDWFAQLYQNRSDAGDTFLLRTGADIVDKSTLTVFQLQHLARLGRGQRFTYGIDVLLTRPDTEGTITGDNENDDNIDEIGAYVQSNTQLHEQLDLVLALRLDEHNRIANPELSPRAALVFKARSDQTLRLTFNRAFSTPTSNNLYLDLVSNSDPFGLRVFAPELGFSPQIDVRAQGTYRQGFDQGFTFRRGADGSPLFRSPFEPALAAQLASTGLNPGDPGYFIGARGYIALDDPLATNAMWSIGRRAVMSRLEEGLPEAIALQLVTGGMEPETAQASSQVLAVAVVQSLENVVPGQLAGLRNDLKRLNPETTGFVPAANVVDIKRTRPTITQTFELGYKGLVGDKLVVTADFYRTKTRDFIGPLAVETPNVFLDAESLFTALEPTFEKALDDPDNIVLVGAADQLDELPAGLVEGLEAGGNNDGSGVDELTRFFAAGAASIPFGTISPEQAYDPYAVIFTYRNFGQVEIKGLDLGWAYYAADGWTIRGSFSYVDDNFFANVDGIADIALHAPKTKFRLDSIHRFPSLGLQVGGRVRYNGSFPMGAGVLVGEVDSYTLLDLNLVCRLPIDQALYLKVNIENVLDYRHREFIAAPRIGRLAHVQCGVEF